MPLGVSAWGRGWGQGASRLTRPAPGRGRDVRFRGVRASAPGPCSTPGHGFCLGSQTLLPAGVPHCPGFPPSAPKTRLASGGPRVASGPLARASPHQGLPGLFHRKEGNQRVRVHQPSLRLSPLRKGPASGCKAGDQLRAGHVLGRPRAHCHREAGSSPHWAFWGPAGGTLSALGNLGPGGRETGQVATTARVCALDTQCWGSPGLVTPRLGSP